MMNPTKWLAAVFASALGAQSWAQDLSIIEQINRTSVPKVHLEKLVTILEKYQSECDRLYTSDLYIDYEEPAPKIQVDPQAIYRVKIHSSGSEATVFQANLFCGNFGNAWRATGSTRTFLLVGDTVYENWLAGPPQTLKIDGEFVLVLPLTSDQCSFVDESVLVDANDECYAALIWEPTAEDFYGYGTPLMLNHEI
jgi:hypothetical protein